MWDRFNSTEVFGFPVWIWVTILASAGVRSFIKRNGNSRSRALTAGAVGVFCAVVFTKPTLAIAGWPMDPIGFGVAAAWALLGEHFLRMILDLKLDELIRAWRGK